MKSVTAVAYGRAVHNDRDWCRRPGRSTPKQPVQLNAVKGNLVKRLILVAALALGLALPALVQGAIPQPIYFWGSVAATIKAPGQPTELPAAIRPSVIYLTADGSADVEHLRWTGWGSSVAHATGISSASNGIPNMAQGKRIKKPAQVTLSNPGLFQGREVYRCFTLTVPPAATGAPSCLTDRGGYWSLSGTSSKGNASTPAGIRRVSFYSPSRNLSCVMLDGSRTSSFRNGVNCQSVDLPHAVSMGLDGQLKICHGLTACVYPHPGVSDIPKMVLGYGKQITVGRFRCRSEHAGVTCTVIKSGKGFLINSAGITRVGP
jgi:hypothetical protein